MNNVITIRDFMECVNYKITEGDLYGWSCYGSNSYLLSSWNGDNEQGHTVTIIFDTKTQFVYEMSVCDYKNNRAYRWIHPNFIKLYKNNAKNAGADPDEAWDDVQYINIEVVSDILEKSKAIVQGKEYDTRVSVQLDLTDEEMLVLFNMAHEKDITLNKLVEELLSEFIIKNSHHE